MAKGNKNKIISKGKTEIILKKNLFRVNTQIKRQISGTTNRDKIEIEINRDKIFRDTSAMLIFQYIDYTGLVAWKNFKHSLKALARCNLI